MQNKKGISLIVLVITIIVMIILAASVIISLTNTGVVDRASQAVQLTDEKQVQDLAAMTWSEMYLDGHRGETLATKVKEKLATQGVIATDWYMNITDTSINVAREHYVPGMYNDEGTIVKTWEALKSENIIKVENGVLTIEDESKIESALYISAEVTEIAAYIGYESSLYTILIPATVKKIGAEAFAKSHFLSNVRYYGTTAPEVSNTAFQYCQALNQIHVPSTYSETTFGGWTIVKDM